MQIPFSVSTPTTTAVAGEVLNNVRADDMEDDANYKLLRYMDMAMNPVPDEESAASDFAVHLLALLGYVPRNSLRLTRTHADITLLICGEESRSNIDACIVESDDILLVIQENKKHKELKDPESQLIAMAIAAFQRHNLRRTQILGQDPILHKVIPGITLIGTSPIFYKIPVTTELANGVVSGIYPATPTIVHAHLPQSLARIVV